MLKRDRQPREFCRGIPQPATHFLWLHCGLVYWPEVFLCLYLRSIYLSHWVYIRISEYLGSNPAIVFFLPRHPMACDLADENQSSELDPCSARPAHPHRQSERLPPPPEAWTRLSWTRLSGLQCYSQSLYNDKWCKIQVLASISQIIDGKIKSYLCSDLSTAVLPQFWSILQFIASSCS